MPDASPPNSAAEDPLHARAGGAARAVAILFLMHGILTGGWAPHVPLAKERLDIGTGAFGWVLLSLALGGVIAMPLAGALIGRWGSAPVSLGAGLLMALASCLPFYAATPLALAASLFVFGAALGSLDVAMNAHGVAVEDHVRRAVMSSFHGWYSVGAAIGAGGGGLVVATGGRHAHAVLAAATALAMLWFVKSRLLPAAVDRGASGAHFSWPTAATATLGALAFLALLVEGAMLDWSALHLRDNMGAGLALAGAGFAAFSTGMAVTRFMGDRLRMRVGAVRLVRLSALALGLGLIATIAAPHPIVSVVAMVVAGLGVGNIAPVLFAGGGRAEPDAPGRGIAAVTTMGYSGFLIGPPLIGIVAEGTGLQLALLLTPAAAFVIAALAGAAASADVTRGDGE